ncbi:MAG: glycosyltransferase [Patescibacteria group bacterium]
MKFIYLTTKKYPGNTADHHYVRNLAYAFSEELREDFAFISCNTEKDALLDIPLVNVSIPTFLKKTFAFFFWLPWFYLKRVKPNRQSNEQIIFFSNDFNLIIILIFWKFIFSLPIKIIADWHHFTHSWKDRFVASHTDCSITTSHKLENFIHRIAHLARVHTVYGGVDLTYYNRQDNISTLRKELGLPEKAFFIGYIGLFTTMGMEKGISVMIEGLVDLDSDFIMVFVGGKLDEIEKYTNYAKLKGVLEKCIFLSIQPFEKVVLYEQVMDVLTIPYPDKPHFRDNGFPMKVYEYMASKRPILYSKLEFVEEVVSDCGYGFMADDSHDLARAIMSIRNNPNDAKIKAEKAFIKVAEYTWIKKAKNIIKFSSQTPPRLIIPDDSIKYILFQRTAYIIYINNIWINKIIIRIPFLTYNRMFLLEARLFKKRTKRLFSEDMMREYEIIKEFLPSKPQNILDIGCGVAGIDIMLHKYYKSSNHFPDFYLLDKTELNKNVYYGIEKVAAHYNSLSVARNLLEINGVESSKIHTQEVTGSPIFSGRKFDLIISLISWGFHYPISTYLDEVYNALLMGGILIVDVRKKTDGELLLEKKFGPLQIIFEAQKYRRVLVIKK